jgi:hypothetical protein
MKLYLYDQIINLNISKVAKKIIEQDTVIFKLDKASTFNGFINYLITTYIEMDEFEFTLNLDYTKIKDKGEAKPFRISEYNYNALQSYEYSIDYNKVISSSAPILIKAITETYARLPYIAREGFVYHNLFNKCNDLIATNNLVSILYKEEKSELIMKPLFLSPSKDSNFTYLVGVTSNDSETRVRLSKIKFIRKLSQTKKVPQSKKDSILEKIVEFGPTFIGEKIETIKVRLTLEGIKEYESSIIRRPIHTKIEPPNIYVFECSQRQAFYFFQRFTSDAYVISPISLREKLKDCYEKGVLNYNK